MYIHKVSKTLSTQGETITKSYRIDGITRKWGDNGYISLAFTH